MKCIFLEFCPLTFHSSSCITATMSSDDAWNQLPTELIVESFKGCVLMNALYGKEDDKIHCFKPNGPIPIGCQLLQKARADTEMAELIQQIEIDEEEDVENGYESDASIDLGD